MESYGTLDLPSVTETDQGYIDITSPRSSYPMSKRMVELLCNCYHLQYGLKTNVVRLSMTFGAGEDFQNDNRVWAQFARSAISGENIILHTEGKSVTSVCYLPDVLRGIFLVLLNAPKGEVYNIASTHCSIREFAESVAEKFGLAVKIEIPADAVKLGYANEFRLPINSAKVQKLGWLPQVAKVDDMIEKLRGDYRE
jgi:nucleoside-diphosphate-sugar epimerase